MNLLRRGLRLFAAASAYAVAAPIALVWLLVYLAVATFAALLVAAMVNAVVLDIPPSEPIDTIGEAVLPLLVLAMLWTVAFGLWVDRTGVNLWFRRRSGDTHGSARFATKKELLPLRVAVTRPGGLLIGRDPKSGGLLGYDGPSHLITLAPTRSGKGVGAVIPNLLMAERSVLVIDPKGENTRITEMSRASLGPVFALDPFGVSGLTPASYNPLDALDPESLDLGENATTLAEALVMDPPGQVNEAHWNEEAKALIAGLILFCVSHEDGDRRTLATIREYLTLPPERFRELLVLMQESAAAHGLVARAANRHLGKNDREAASVLSNAQRHTHFLDSPRIAAATARSDFRFADLRHELISVFLVLPPDRLAAYSRWLRLLVAQALQEIARDAQAAQQAPHCRPAPPDTTGDSPDALSAAQTPSQRPGGPVLFLLDEFAALGRLEAVERAMGLMAGYGLQLWPILQDLTQLRDLYGPRAGTFFANAGVIQAFGVNDVETAKWLSETMGKETIGYSTLSYRPGDDATTSEHVAGRELLTPDEIMRLGPDLQLLRLQGLPPVLARKLRYYADKEFQGFYPAQQHDQRGRHPERTAP